MARQVPVEALGLAQMAKPIPRPSILDDFEYVGARSGGRRWRSHGGRRIYTWDSLHGEVEVFNARGKHLGALDPVTGKQVKPAVPGRTIDV
jgi:hypothetical protein